MARSAWPRARHRAAKESGRHGSASLVRHPSGRRRRRPAARSRQRGLEQMRDRIRHRFRAKQEEAHQGDELPPGVRRWSRSMWRSSVACSRATRWPAVTVTRVWFRASRRSRTCPIWRDGDAGRYRAEPAGRAVPDERRPGLGSPPRLGGQGPGFSRSTRCCVPNSALEVRGFLDKVYNSTARPKTIDG